MTHDSSSDEKINFTLPDGQPAHIESSDGDKTTVACPVPSPPGSLVRGRIETVACELQLKVRNCKKKGELFYIDGRLQNATRELKAHIQKHMK